MDTAQVMIVEDKSQVALDVQDCLETLGYGVTGIIASGEESIEIAEKKHPDLVLMDIHLRDEMDGIEAADQIYSKFGIPVIFLSAYADSDLLKRAGTVGSFGYLVKPFKENELRAMLEMTLHKAKAEKERDAANAKLLKLQASLESILDSVIPICVTDLNKNILKTNKSYRKAFYHKSSSLGKCYDSRPGEDCMTDICPIPHIKNTNVTELTWETVKRHRNGEKTFLVNARPYRDDSGKTIGIVETFQDITFRKLEEKIRETMIKDLKKAKEEIKTIKGIIPICMHCKEIRDEQGSWSGLEKYISEHSGAEFSHGICDKCLKKHYSDD